MVLKVFKPNTSLDIIRRENDLCKNAFVSGIPTAISYDVVQVGDCYGAVYELLNAEDFKGCLRSFLTEARSFMGTVIPATSWFRAGNWCSSI